MGWAKVVAPVGGDDTNPASEPQAQCAQVALALLGGRKEARLQPDAFGAVDVGLHIVEEQRLGRLKTEALDEVPKDAFVRFQHADLGRHHGALEQLPERKARLQVCDDLADVVGERKQPVASRVQPTRKRLGTLDRLLMIHGME